MAILNRIRILTGIAAGLCILASSTAADAKDITVGFITSLSGPVSSLGIPYQKGIKTAIAYQGEIGGHKIKVIELDDASNPTEASRNARKLIDEEKVDIILGSAGGPSTLAIAAIARENKTQQLALSNTDLPGPDGAWMITIPQSAPLMISAVIDRMKANGVKTVGYIGYSDSWGDLVYNSLVKAAQSADIKVVSNERYARSDSAVTGQIIKIVALRPDAVITGTSGTPGALPYLELAKRNYKGQIYGMHSLINPEFVRVAGSSADGMLLPSGPVIVAQDLPADNPIRKISLEFQNLYQKVNGAAVTDEFSAYSFDAWLIFLDAAKRALTKAEPGTPEFRQALHEAITSTKELVGTHGVYNFNPNERYGTDARSRLMIKLDKGQWTLVK
jgi:branched-chain amino acid transport system substrate-binding protein